MSDHKKLNSVLDLRPLFSKAVEGKQQWSPLARTVLLTQVLIDYIENGGALNTVRSPHFSEAMYIHLKTAIIGLSVYLNLGGQLSPDFRDKKGNNELMMFLQNVNQDTKHLLQVFHENGGKFVPDHQNEDGENELIHLIEYAPKDILFDALQFYLDNGGYIPENTKDAIDQNILQALVERAGAKGLQFFFENNGKIDPNHRNCTGTSELVYVMRTGVEGLQLYIENGGRFNCDYSQGDLTDAMSLAFQGDPELLQCFVDNEGVFAPEIKNEKGFTEAMLIAEFVGAEGLDIFMANGGLYQPSNAAELSGEHLTEKGLFEKAYGGKIPAHIVPCEAPAPLANPSPKPLRPRKL